MTNEISQAPFATPPLSYYPERENKRPKKGLAKLIFGLIVIILLGTGVSLAARIWDPLWNPFRPAPEKVIEKMSKRMADVKTFHSEVMLDFEVKEEEAPEAPGLKMAMTIKGDSDNTDPQALKTAGDFDIVANFAGMQISLTGESITIGKDTYVKLTTIPLPLMMFGLDEIQGQWIKYGDEKTEEAKEIEKETIKKLEEILKDKKLYIVKKEFPDEKIKNVKVYHYLVALNKEEIKNLLPKLFKIMVEDYKGTSPISFDEEEFEKELEKILPKVDEFFEKIGEITAEIWIGKKDNYPYKIKAEKEIDMSQFDETAKGKITIKADIDFSNFNQPVKIEAPKDFKALKEIMPSAISPETFEGFLELP